MEYALLIFSLQELRVPSGIRAGTLSGISQQYQGFLFLGILRSGKDCYYKRAPYVLSRKGKVFRRGWSQ